MIDFLIEHGSDLFLALTFVICQILNRPKDAEKVLAIKKKKHEKKVAKLESKAKKTMSQLQELADEELQGD